MLFAGLLIAPANAQNEKNMYSYKKIGNRYIVSIDNHAEIVNALNAFCKEKKIRSGSISGIGAIGELTLRFFNPQTKAYEDKTFREPCHRLGLWKRNADKTFVRDGTERYRH